MDIKKLFEGVDTSNIDLKKVEKLTKESPKIENEALFMKFEEEYESAYRQSRRAISNIKTLVDIHQLYTNSMFPTKRATKHAMKVKRATKKQKSTKIIRPASNRSGIVIGSINERINLVNYEINTNRRPHPYKFYRTSLKGIISASKRRELQKRKWGKWEE